PTTTHPGRERSPSRPLNRFMPQTRAFATVRSGDEESTSGHLMDAETWGNIGLVLLFILIGGVFAGTEFALVSLRESQIRRLHERGPRGRRVASVARDPNRFLSAVQIGVTVAGFFSAAYGA